MPGICVKPWGHGDPQESPGPTQRETQSDGGRLTSSDSQRSECLGREAHRAAGAQVREGFLEEVTTQLKSGGCVWQDEKGWEASENSICKSAETEKE